MKKLKLLGIPAVLLAGMLTLFTPSPANAKVRWGVEIGSPYYAPYPYGYGPYGYVYGGPYWHHHHWRYYRHYR